MTTFTSTITESVTLNGAVRGSTNTVAIADIDYVAEKIMECPAGTARAAQTVIGNWASVTNAAQYQSYDYNDSKYIRVTNLSETVTIEVAFVSNGQDNQCTAAKSADSCRFTLQPAQTAIMWDSERGKLGEATVPNFNNAPTDLSYIVISNPTFGESAESVNIELFVAGKKKAA